MCGALPPTQNGLLENIFFLNIYENHKNMTMKLKCFDLEVILMPFWTHLGVLGDLRGPFGVYWANLRQHKQI